MRHQKSYFGYSSTQVVSVLHVLPKKQKKTQPCPHVNAMNIVYNKTVGKKGCFIPRCIKQFLTHAP